MADKTTTLKTKTNDNVYPNVIGDNRDNAIVNSAHIKHTLTADHKINFRLDDNVSNLIFNSLQKPAGLTKTKLVGVGTNGQENIEIGDNLTLANGKLSATGGGSGGEGGISIIELTDKTGTIASTQLSEINANPQNFAFKYKGKILLFTSADSTNYQYCNNTTSSSDNNVMTTSTLLTITSSTGAYTIAENVHNVVANSIHPANGGDLTNIQVGSKVYSIPSGGNFNLTIGSNNYTFNIEAKTYNPGDHISDSVTISSVVMPALYSPLVVVNDCVFIVSQSLYSTKISDLWRGSLYCVTGGTVTESVNKYVNICTFKKA